MPVTKMRHKQDHFGPRRTDGDMKLKLTGLRDLEDTSSREERLRRR